jgi:ATPase subunit of ABC transporter with duplicated ATPase domains
MIKAQNIKASYGEKTVFKNLSFEINKNEKICLTGINGSGKSTLCKIISAVKEIDSGTLTLCEKTAVSAPWIQPYSELTVDENISLVLSGNEKLKAIEYYTVLNGERSGTLYGNLSTGNMKKVNLSIALAQSAETLILDEPYTYLDSKSKAVLEKILTDYTETLIVTSHERLTQHYREINLDV